MATKTAVKKTTSQKSKTTTAKQLKVTLVKSIHGRLVKHQQCVRGLGLRKIGHTVLVEKTPANLGMIKKVEYLLSVSVA